MGQVEAKEATESAPESEPETSSPPPSATDSAPPPTSETPPTNSDSFPSGKKDKVIFLTEEEASQPSKVSLAEKEDDGPPGLILPNGEINWNCPCLGGMAVGPCGVEFREAFSCFHYSTADPKGSDCIEKFADMQICMQGYPELYNKETGPEPIEEEEAIKSPDGDDASPPAESANEKAADSSNEKTEVANEKAGESDMNTSEPTAASTVDSSSSAASSDSSETGSLSSKDS
eukprot:TRINITY_DN17489_c0_g1_i1.p1 TRINITY_DN17489_c0_g1~~TRINITY_DN17489_c0_g1_i1.p1  ORF type:complete len:241 (-),score=65.80 TRINITY_DN17489_c0_g1_i1:89-784(-)